MGNKLENRDFVIVLDKSGSMSSSDTKSGQSRWKEGQELVLAMARKCEQYDPDGMVVIPFASSFRRYENVTSGTVEQIFRENEPMGGTTLGPVLQNVFGDYLSRKSAGKTKPNGEICIVVTDGAPTDPDAVAKEIVAFTKKLDNADDEYGILFLQVGQDIEATRFLKKLDDDLVALGAAHDIVDTKTVEEVEKFNTIGEVLEQALND